MKVLKFEDCGIGQCTFCEQTIPSRGFIVFRHEETKKMVCSKCAQAITRTFIQDSLGLDGQWQIDSK